MLNFGKPNSWFWRKWGHVPLFSHSLLVFVLAIMRNKCAGELFAFDMWKKTHTKHPHVSVLFLNALTDRNLCILIFFDKLTWFNFQLRFSPKAIKTWHICTSPSLQDSLLWLKLNIVVYVKSVLDWVSLAGAPILLLVSCWFVFWYDQYCAEFTKRWKWHQNYSLDIVLPAHYAWLKANKVWKVPPTCLAGTVQWAFALMARPSSCAYY